MYIRKLSLNGSCAEGKKLFKDFIQSQLIEFISFYQIKFIFLIYKIISNFIRNQVSKIKIIYLAQRPVGQLSNTKLETGSKKGFLVHWPFLDRMGSRRIVFSLPHRSRLQTPNLHNSTSFHQPH